MEMRGEKHPRGRGEGQTELYTGLVVGQSVPGNCWGDFTEQGNVDFCQFIHFFCCLPCTKSS